MDRTFNEDDDRKLAAGSAAAAATANEDEKALARQSAAAARAGTMTAVDSSIAATMKPGAVSVGHTPTDNHDASVAMSIAVNEAARKEGSAAIRAAIVAAAAAAAARSNGLSQQASSSNLVSAHPPSVRLDSIHSRLRQAQEVPEEDAAVDTTMGTSELPQDGEHIRNTRELESVEQGLAIGTTNGPGGDIGAGDPVQAVSVNVALEEHLPTAHEYDPDARQRRYLNVEWYSIIVACLLVLVALSGAITSYCLPKPATLPPALADRAVLGMREYVTQYLVPPGETTAEDVLSDPTHPYGKALDWIQNDDPMALTLDNATFAQRFLVAYFYFSTSMLQPWDSGCSPASVAPDSGGGGSNKSTDNDATIPDDRCTFDYHGVVDPVAAYKRDAMRWLSGANECEWAGVSCDHDGHANTFDFEGLDMTGAFPDGVARLPFLRFLCLSNNAPPPTALSTNLGLTGSLPTVLGAMKHLRSVELAGNLFNGSIPDGWYQTRGLQKLNVGANMLTGSISPDIGKWKDLRAGLFLYDNNLVGSIPSTIGRLESLMHMHLNDNALTSNIPTEIGKLRRCQEFDLHRNKLTSSIPTQIGLMTNLGFISLRENQMNSTIPLEMSNISNLFSIDIGNNNFTGGIQPLLNSIDIDSIYIENNQFSGTLPTDLGRLSYLYAFVASGNQLVGTVSRKVCKLRATANAGLEVLQLDCAVPSAVGDTGAAAEITCPDGCCTRCCDANGQNCQDMVVD